MAKWLGAWLRYPKTTQELRANQDRNDPYVRSKRRNIPTAWDDQFVRKQKSWKYLSKRKKQYRTDNADYDWHEFDYHWSETERRMIARNIMRHLESIGCLYEHTREGIRWFGPEVP